MANRLATFQPSEVFPFVAADNSVKAKHPFVVGERTYHVKMSSDRLITFKANQKCVCCGIEGSFFALEQKTKENPHFNFYAIKDGQDVLMTKDHIVPISRGGLDHLDNYQTMCYKCNELKANKPDMVKPFQPPNESGEYPDTIEWPGRGTAHRVMPRGMSDYPRIGHNRVYALPAPGGFMLHMRGGYVTNKGEYKREIGWKAQSKSWTSPSMPTAEEAMAWIDKQLSRTVQIPSSVEWPNRGVANVSAVKHEKGYTIFLADGNARLTLGVCSLSRAYPDGLKWIAQLNEHTTSWLPSAQEAIACVEKMAKDKEELGLVGGAA